MRISRIKLATALAQRDLNVKELAAAASVSRATVSGVKCGKTCTRETAQKIAAALNMPLEQLMETAP